MPEHIELNPATHFTIGTIGEPGNRVFYLQGGQGSDTISLVIEKAQAAALAESFESLLKELEKKFPQLKDALKVEEVHDMRLRQPAEPLFRVGNLGLGFQEEVVRIVLVAYELVPEEDDPSVVSFWASVGQVRAMIDQARAVVKSGRPICGNCGKPIDPDGHFCPHRNGYKR